MNLKFFALSIFAVTGIVSSSFLAAAPAEALTITGGSILDLGGDARFNKNTGKLDFKTINTGAPGKYNTPSGNAVVTAFSNTFGEVGTIANLKDLQLTGSNNTWTLSSPVLQFITLPNGIKFRLDTFDLNFDGNTWLASLIGEFDYGVGNVIGGSGNFDPRKDGDFITAKGSSYTLGVEADVPTPALLPGLIGIGLTALRKRNKSEAEESTEA